MIAFEQNLIKKKKGGGEVTMYNCEQVIKIIEKQLNSKLIMVAAQHEGAKVNQSGLNCEAAAAVTRASKRALQNGSGVGLLQNARNTAAPTV